MSESPLEAAVSDVARKYGPELIRAAQALADAARDDVEFMRLWLGIGEFARLGLFDLDSADAGSTTPAPASATIEGE